MIRLVRNALLVVVVVCCVVGVYTETTSGSQQAERAMSSGVAEIQPYTLDPTTLGLLGVGALGALLWSFRRNSHA